jgi:uncharacterized protein YggE
MWNCLAVYVAVLSGAASAAAEPAPALISVSGVGDARGKPNVVEISAVVSGEAELAEDAITKYQNSKRRCIEAIEGLKLEGLTVQGQGVGINSGSSQQQMAAMMRGQPNAGVKPSIEVTEKLLVQLAGIEKLETEKLIQTLVQLVDAVKDTGVRVGPGTMNMMQMQMQGGQAQPIAAFKIDDVEEIRAKAYQRAMSEAKKSAQRLADLAGVKLGGVHSVSDSSSTPEVYNNPRQFALMMYGALAGGEEEDASMSSPILREIPVQVRLQVQFKIGGE